MIRVSKAHARQLLEIDGGILGAALLGLLLCASVRAEVLHLATGDDYAPFTGKALPGQGMLTQVVRAALAEQGTAITLDWLPWNRGYLKAKRVEYNATFPYIRSAEREAEFLYSAPIYVAEPYIFSRAGDHIELDDLPAMIGRRLCYPLGWQPPAAIQQMVEQGVLRRHSPLGLQECARLLLLERDDLFIADRNLGAVLCTVLALNWRSFTGHGCRFRAVRCTSSSRGSTRVLPS